ncbi:spherulation-specific family 4 protein [Aspergillus saccharolyticus JOP 1030-1]|uniref:Cell surface spherulin 4-like protein n=1 Tax=Aspergillus saccharolyticus JOP 1030-1 TaxID=1450539 RepID=A0A318ZB45_9EURO|nr:cell surface spherulin 4-like protein [Aspergillus saccharolyticus JOP 1030-1]PYH41933.1 cell surface spherulin 4-like protein [Aspergillus saccharolyticus JOP 1030-1]
MMGQEKHVRDRRCLPSTRSRVIFAVFVFIAILAVVIPPAVVVTLHKKNSMGPKASVFVPLYVYPAPGAWDPLEKVVSTHPDVNFTVVVNPGSGPGPNALPDANYTREVPKLASYDNVRLLGYVATTYANRNISLVRRDIETYAAWPTNSSNPKLAVRGIFFDETPQQYDASTLAYLQELTAVVKNHSGLGPDNYVVHNPGVIPDSRYLSTADSTVVFEATYQTFLDRQGAKLFEQIPNSTRQQLTAVVHSVPSSVEGSSFRNLVKQVRKVADEMFITHLDTNYYASFGSQWEQFVDLMAKS